MWHLNKVKMRTLVIISLFMTFGFSKINAQNENSCSCISLTSGDTVIFGRNHDAVLSNCLIVFNPRNVYKEGFEFENEVNPKWTAKYSSITFNVLGVGFAVSGMNEKGLAIGHMGFSEAEYQPKDDKPVVDQIQFITYILDNCANTEEVIRTAENIRISDESSTKEHYFICDAGGNTAILEHIQGKLIVYTNETMPYTILSNENYEKSLQYLEDYEGFGGTKKIPEKNFGIQEIMAIGCSYINNYKSSKKDNIINSSFDLLNNIGFNKFPPPDSLNVHPDYGTQFTTVFDLKNLIVYFKTKSNSEVKEIFLKDFDQECPAPFMIMEAESQNKGLVNFMFKNYSKETNYNFINTRLQKSGTPKEVIDFLANYPDSFKCK